MIKKSLSKLKKIVIAVLTFLFVFDRRLPHVGVSKTIVSDDFLALREKCLRQMRVVENELSSPSISDLRYKYSLETLRCLTKAAEDFESAQRNLGGNSYGS